MPRTYRGTNALLLVCVLATVGGAGRALAVESAEEILKRVDETLSRAKDQYLVYDMVTTEAGKPDRVLTFEVTIKGKHWRRVELLAPGDVKGTRILIRSPTQTYVYLPAYRKIRRVASHIKEQGFMGSAWDNDEMSLAVFGEVFRAKAVKDHRQYWTLFLEQREGQDFVYHALEVDVRKDITQPVEIRYLNTAGKTVKTEKRLRWGCGNDICGPRIIEMIDHNRNNMKTIMTRKAWKVNQNIPDSFFTVRALQRGG